MPEITIIFDGKDLKPKGLFRQQVATGSTVKFKAEGFDPKPITFEGRSPFGETTLYTKELKVTAAFDSTGKNNIYPFTCSGIVNGKEIHSKGANGGEIEIVPGG
jgi:hypothetical protein